MDNAMNIPTRDEIREAYRQGEEAIIQLVERLIQELQAQQDRLNKNSKNSSKPPSSDGFKKTRTKNLLDRLKEYTQEVLAFMYDFSAEGADAFCAIRGYISTARKNGCRVLDALHDTLRGSPFIPSVGSIGLTQG
jgi:hypothetical protein